MNANLKTNLGEIVGRSLWLEQLKAMGLTVALPIGATVVIAYAIKFAIGLRPSIDAEEEGLDQTDHGEAGYHFDEEGAHGGYLDGSVEGTETRQPRALARRELDGAGLG